MQSFLWILNFAKAYKSCHSCCTRTFSVKNPWVPRVGSSNTAVLSLCFKAKYLLGPPHRMILHRTWTATKQLQNTEKAKITTSFPTDCDLGILVGCRVPHSTTVSPQMISMWTLSPWFGYRPSRLLTELLILLSRSPPVKNLGRHLSRAKKIQFVYSVNKDRTHCIFRQD